VGITAFVLGIAVRSEVHFHTHSGRLLPLDFVLHGWPLVVVNVAFYIFLGWVGFSFVRGTKAAERVFMVGWFANILLSPIETLRPQWAGAIKGVGMFGLVAALLAGVSLLLRSSAPADSN
jgi:hypothetical protein